MVKKWAKKKKKSELFARNKVFRDLFNGGFIQAGTQLQCLTYKTHERVKSEEK